MLFKSLFLVSALGVTASCASPASACPALDAVVNSSRDASEALLECISQTPDGRINLAAGTYLLRKQVQITKPVIITTVGIEDSAAACDRLTSGACATLITRVEGQPNPNIMPIEIVADGIQFSHLVIRGSDEAKTRVDCTQPDRRPLGGGLRVRGSGFTIRKSSLRDFTCYTTMEVLAGVKRLTIEDNVIGPNGDHRPGDIWADGITVLDAEDAVVRNNRFVDNTDVQLIFGGCRRCQVQGNVFRHSGAFKGASFAGLMLQAFPSTTGDYSGTIVSGNDIDCGPSRRCGYGIMIGANPWKAGDDPRYPGAMFGGTISGNTVSNAMIGINIDSPTGPVAITGNRVRNSGGRYLSDCGERTWPAVNVAPGASRFINGDPSDQSEGSTSSTSCIVNRQPL